MKTRVKRTPIAILLCALALAAGCGREIGDECRTSADCDPNGLRACDLSQPGGYCTVIGCDGDSCPDDSACLRYFPEKYLLDAPSCDPALEDIPVTKIVNGKEVTTIQNKCAADELCVNMGKCVRRSFEQRSCAKTCSGNDDCRGGYECRASNSLGSMLLSEDPVSSPTTRFCAPKPKP
jgi:hypothetical protein